MIASGKGHSEVVDKLLDKGASIEAQDKVTYLISSYLSVRFSIDPDFGYE